MKFISLFLVVLFVAVVSSAKTMTFWEFIASFVAFRSTRKEKILAMTQDRMAVMMRDLLHLPLVVAEVQGAKVQEEDVVVVQAENVVEVKAVKTEVKHLRIPTNTNIVHKGDVFT